MPRPKAGQRTALTRERILLESARVFNRRGYHGTTLDDIARALGVTKAALYYHVKSKEELLFECHEIAHDIGIEGLHRAPLSNTSQDEQLRIALAYYIEGVTDHLKGVVLLLEEGALSPAHHRRILERRDEYERVLRKIIRDGIAAGVFVPCDPKVVGFAIMGAMNSIPKWYSHTGSRSPKDIAETYSSYLVRGLQKHPSTAPILPLED